MSKYVYPAIFEPEDGMYNISFPDIPDCYTCGDDLTDAVHMAEDALSGYLARAEEMKREIPRASSASDIQANNGCIISLVLADTEEFRRRTSTKAVKKTLTIPAWMNEAAEAQSINFSAVLQEALRQKLGLVQNQA